MVILARYLKQSTKLGAFLDPVADKLMVSIALVLIVAEPTFQYVSVTSAIVSIPSPVIHNSCCNYCRERNYCVSIAGMDG